MNRGGLCVEGDLGFDSNKNVRCDMIDEYQALSVQQMNKRSFISHGINTLMECLHYY